MRRQDRYPNTDIFHYENRNPKNRITADCVVRAISKAMGWSWQKTLTELTTFSLETGFMVNDTKCYKRFFEKRKWLELGQPRKADGTKYTVKEFIALHPKGTYLVNMANHLTVVVDGINYDIWDCTKVDKRVGMVWQKPARLTEK